MRNFIYHLTFCVFLTICSVGIFSCEEEDALPPITMEGKNTFGCLVDGALWLPGKMAGQGGALINLTSSKDTVVINIYADNSITDSGVTLSIWGVPNIQAGKVYDLTENKYYANYLNYSTGVSCEYDVILKGEVELLKFDLSKNIVAGTFEFTAYSPDCMDSVRVSEGRFDIGEIIL